MIQTQHKNGIGSAPVVTTPPDTGLRAWMGEIANLINTKPLTVIQTIELTTNKKFIGTTYGDLARAVGTLLKTNLRFRAAMVILVHLNNGLINYNQITSGDYQAAIAVAYGTSGANYKNVGGDPITWILEGVSAVLNLTNKITTAALNRKTAKISAQSNAIVAADQKQAAADLDQAAIESELMTVVQTKITTDAAKNASAADGVSADSESNNGLWIALIVVLGLGGVFLFSQSGNSSIIAMHKKETGGPATTPVAPAAAKQSELISGVTEIKF